MDEKFKRLREGSYGCGKAHTEISHPLAFVLLILNIMTGGSGTILSGIFDESGFNQAAVSLGFFQCLLAPFVIGWFWGIMHMWANYSYQKKKHDHEIFKKK